jgi:hypothetical protein
MFNCPKYMNAEPDISESNLGFLLLGSGYLILPGIINKVLSIIKK